MHHVQVEQLIISELEELSQTGFSKASIEAAVNSIEFDLRENNTGRFPRGLSLMLRSMSAWIYDRDPLSRLRWTEPLEHFKVLSRPSCACVGHIITFCKAVCLCGVLESPAEHVQLQSGCRLQQLLAPVEAHHYITGLLYLRAQFLGLLVH